MIPQIQNTLRRREVSATILISNRLSGNDAPTSGADTALPHDPFLWGVATSAFQLWTPSDLLWDSDINPEGGWVGLTLKAEPVSAFFATGLWVIDEYKSEGDPLMFRNSSSVPGILNMGSAPMVLTWERTPPGQLSTTTAIFRLPTSNILLRDSANSKVMRTL